MGFIIGSCFRVFVDGVVWLYEVRLKEEQEEKKHMREGERMLEKEKETCFADVE